MKKLKKITASTLVFAFAFSLASKETLAQEITLTPAEKSCEEFKVAGSFYEEGNLTEAWELPDPIDSKIYDEQFEKAQDAYHHYVACMFQFAENTVYQSEGSYQGGAVQANTPNTNIIDWMAPNEACISSTELKKIVGETSPNEMLGPLLQALTDYKKYLTALNQQYSNTGIEVDSAGNPRGGSDELLTKVDFLTEADRKVQVELNSAMVAMDLMLNALKELRTSFVLHVHFQCTIKYLDNYRKALEKLRNLIQPLPGQLQDASVTK